MQSVEQYRRSIAEQITTLKERAKSGDFSLSPGSLQRLEKLEKLSASGRILLMSYGMGPVKPEDIVEPE